MKKNKVIIEGKSKKFYEIDESRLFMVFKPYLRSITSEREENILNTDLERLKVNYYIMLIMEYHGIKTHLISKKIEKFNNE